MTSNPTRQPHTPIVGVVVLLGVLVATWACGPRYNPRRIVYPQDMMASDGGEPRDVDPSELRGEASWYGERFHGRTTASGEPFDMYQFTAAHRTLPFGTVVRVQRDDTRQSVVVRVNDRGPYSDGRVIDLSWAAAYDLGMVDRGTADVSLTVLQWP